MRISTRNGGKIAENRASTDVIPGLMVDLLRFIDVNGGGLRLKKGQGILHLTMWGRAEVPTIIFVWALGFFREGVNREKLTVKKIISIMRCFFTVYVPYKP